MEVITHHHRRDVIGLAAGEFEYLEHDGLQHALGGILNKKKCGDGTRDDMVHLDERPDTPPLSGGVINNYIIPNAYTQRTCILCLSMTLASSCPMGRGVLLTTTRSIHCSHTTLSS